MIEFVSECGLSEEDFMEILKAEYDHNAKVRMILNLVYSVSDYHNFLDMMK